MYIASPPIRGVGCRCTSRSRGIGDGADAGGQHADPARREVGDDRRGEPDERELAQRNARASIGEREQPAGHSPLRSPLDEPYWTDCEPWRARQVVAVSVVGVDTEYLRDRVGGHRALAAGSAGVRR